MDVVGIGALNVDRLHRVERIPKLGEEVPIFSITVSPGGSAANTVVGLSRLGIKTGFVGRVGNDEDGRFILNDLKKEGVDTRSIKVEAGKTGNILGFVDKDGERVLYAYPGVNDALRIDESNVEYAASAKFLHMSSFVGEYAYNAQKKLLERLSSTKISFSPGMLYAGKKLAALEPIIKRSEVVFLNKKELAMLTGLEVEEGSEKLVNSGAGIVAVTLGEKGCYIRCKEKGIYVKGLKTKVRDTTGAGDAFAGGFIYGMLRGKDLKTCGRIGNKVASLCISHSGAREGLPYKIESI